MKSLHRKFYRCMSKIILLKCQRTLVSELTIPINRKFLEVLSDDETKRLNLFAKHLLV